MLTPLSVQSEIGTVRLDAYLSVLNDYYTRDPQNVTIRYLQNPTSAEIDRLHCPDGAATVVDGVIDGFATGLKVACAPFASYRLRNSAIIHQCSSRAACSMATDMAAIYCEGRRDGLNFEIVECVVTDTFNALPTVATGRSGRHFNAGIMLDDGASGSLIGNTILGAQVGILINGWESIDQVVTIENCMIDAEIPVLVVGSSNPDRPTRISPGGTSFAADSNSFTPLRLE